MEKRMNRWQCLNSCRYCQRILSGALQRGGRQFISKEADSRLLAIVNHRFGRAPGLPGQLVDLL